MTTEQLNHLEQLATAATPGPWKAKADQYENEVSINTKAPETRLDYVSWDGLATVAGKDEDPLNGMEVAMHNARFIAAAREAIPQLIQAVRALAAPIEVERGAPQWVLVLEGLPEEGPEPTYVLGRWEDGDIRRCQLYNGVLSCGFPARGGYPVYYMAEPIAPPALRQDGHCVACQYPRYILKGQYWGSCSNEDCTAYKQDMASASYLLPAAPLKGGSQHV